VCLLNFLPPFYPSSLSSFLMLFSYLFTSLLVYLLTYFATPSRIDLFRFPAGCHRRRPNLALVFLGSFYVVVYFVMNVCLLLLCLFKFFITKPRDWLGRTALKCPILCIVGRKTITQSINHFGGMLASQSLDLVWLVAWHSGRTLVFGRG